MLQHKQGDLLTMAAEGDFDVIVQGCNCFNAMGGGIARTIAERYPEAQAVDNTTQRGDYTKLGNYTVITTLEREGQTPFILVNAYTQYSTSREGEDVFEYMAFGLICQKLAHQYGHLRIGLPYIGMGLAGGDKEVIMEMIEDFATDVDVKGGSVTLVEYK
jgi:O-acetyl-ADP-ribose deacetylase (regulator of RNase III)